MESLHRIRQMLCEKLDEYSRMPELKTAGMLEEIHLLTDTIKNIDKIKMMGADGGQSHSRGGGWQANGYYDHGTSYGYDDSMGRRMERRDYYRGTSYGDGKEQLIRNLEQMAETATGERREIIHRAVKDLRNT